VLQVRKALFTYTFDKTVGSDAQSQYQFTSRVREALRAHNRTANLKLDEADVNLSTGQGNVVEVRTQAANRDEFNKQKAAIDAALKTISDIKFTAAREPQYFEPEQSNN